MKAVTGISLETLVPLYRRFEKFHSSSGRETRNIFRQLLSRGKRLPVLNFRVIVLYSVCTYLFYQETSRLGITKLVNRKKKERFFHVENFSSQIATFPQFQVHLNVTQAKLTITLSLLNNFYPAMSHPRVQKKKKATNLLCTTRSFVMVRANQLPAEEVKEIYLAQRNSVLQF